MSRPLRFVPEHSLVEITTRTFQGRLLLRPSPELTDIILGIIGKALALYSMTIHAFANVAKEAGLLHLWRERLWSRRYRSIVVADDKAAHARMRYLLAHAAKEGLLASPGAWPGPNCIAALTTGALLRGKWFDRSKEFLARQRGEYTLPMQFATTFDVKLTPKGAYAHDRRLKKRCRCRMREASSEMASEKIIELFVNNHPGVMVHVASLFARRAFNPEGVLCGPLPGGGRSRMLLLVGAQTRLDQVIRQLEKLQDVLEVRERPDLAPSLFDLGAV